jgi:hypothetical protein
MTFDEIALNITPVGYAAAVVGFLLCVAVLMIHFRDRNLILKAKQSKSIQTLSRKKNSSTDVGDVPAQNPKTPSAFKTFVPE